MLIIGAKGFAKEVLEILFQKNSEKEILFFDDVNGDIGEHLYNRFKILKTEEEVFELFKRTKEFTIGIGNPILRKKLYEKFTALGGIFTSTISPFAKIGHFNTTLAAGCNIMTNTIITNDVTIGKGVLINLSCTVGHDVVIEEFSEICPDVNISGNCHIGKSCFIGTNATILPDVVIGDYSIIGAGSIVLKSIPPRVLAVGAPAKISKRLDL